MIIIMPGKRGNMTAESSAVLNIVDHNVTLANGQAWIVQNDHHALDGWHLNDIVRVLDEGDEARICNLRTGEAVHAEHCRELLAS
jgi:hypothetical protein